MPVRRAASISITSWVLCLLVACGGSSGDAAAPVAGGSASGVQGIVTPSSVSVVTAKNAH